MKALPVPLVVYFCTIFIHVPYREPYLLTANPVVHLENRIRTMDKYATKIAEHVTTSRVPHVHQHIVMLL